MSRNRTVLFYCLVFSLFLIGQLNAQLPDPNVLFQDDPEKPKPVVLDSSTAEILGSETLTDYELAKLAIPEYPWNLDLQAKVNSSQSSYSNNWDGSEQGSYVWTADINGRAEKQINPYSNTRTTYRLTFGQTHTQDNETRYWSIPTPSTDRIDIESILRFTLGAIVDPFASARYQSSFLDLRNKDKDYFINPMKFTETFGIARAFFKEKSAELLIRGGFALRQDWDRNYLLNEVKLLRGERWTYDGGLDMVADLKLPLFKERVSFISRLSVYQALFFSEADKIAGLQGSNDWQMVDFDLESSFSSSITKYLSVSLDIWWRYDKEVDKKGRLKQALSLGLAYSFL